MLLRSIIASSALPEPRRLSLDLLQMRKRSLLLLLLVVSRVLLLLLRRRVVGLLLLLLLLLLPVLLLLLVRRRSKTASSISRTVGVVHLHVVRHLEVRGRGHRRGVAPSRDCGWVVEREREGREED